MSIKKWMQEMKQKKNKKDRLKRAIAHAIVSVARLSSSLATIGWCRSSLAKGEELIVHAMYGELIYFLIFICTYIYM